MKIRFLVSSILIACSASAWAQSNITLYGIVDTGVHYIDAGGGSRYNLASGISEGSRIGFKGTEDIGQGLKAIFTLEARFEADTGGIGNGYPTSNQGVALLRGVPGGLIPG